MCLRYEVSMRRLNAILSAVILAMFVIHGFLGALNMLDVAVVITKVMARIMVVLVAVHAVLGGILTVKAIRTRRVTKAPYWKENALFWARRISGVAIVILLVFHVTTFLSASGSVFSLSFFDGFRLTANILLVLSIAVHVITNVKPMLISFGIRRLRPRVGDILFVLSILLILFVIGFIVYYIRWNTI